MPVERSCEKCGKALRVKPSIVKKGGGKFCSRKCKGGRRSGRLERACKTCGATFRVRPSKIKSGGGNFCSRPCTHKGAPRRDRHLVECICKNCGATFLKYPSQIKAGRGVHCSRKCADEAQRTRQLKTCGACGVSFNAIPSTVSKGYANFCSRPCYHLHLKRKNHVNINCANCAQTFTRRRDRVNSERNFCSRRCAGNGSQTRIRETRACQTCGQNFNFRVGVAEKGRRRGLFCSRRCAMSSAEVALASHHANRPNRVWTNAMLRRFLEWTADTCAFPLCESPKSRSTWNLCSLHARRLTQARAERRQKSNVILKENHEQI